ncbi:MAG: glycerophosphodiester phosphodiesterase family protein [Flavobacteriaceae bacterium]
MKIIGHRGFRGLYPENTLIAFIEAVKLGVDAIELDVVMSGDGKIVVSHEPFMSQITCLKPNGKELKESEDQQFNLYQMSYAEIKQFDCGLKDNFKFPNQKSVASYKPLLSEVIDICDSYAKSVKSEIEYIIEIKSDSELYDTFYPNPPKYVEAIFKTLNAYSIYERVVLKSFDVAILNEIKIQRPSQKVSLLINRDESIEDKLKRLDFTPEILGVYFELLSEDVVEHYKNKGFLINAWTVNATKRIQEIIALNIDGVITDYPDRLLK